MTSNMKTGVLQSSWYLLRVCVSIFGRQHTIAVQLLKQRFLEQDINEDIMIYKPYSLRVYGKSAHLHLKFAQNFAAVEFCNL